MEKRTVFIYGESMLVSFVASSLAQCPELQVVHETTWGDVEAQAAACTPDVLIYDLESASEKSILPLLFKNPNLRLIGLDVETNRAVLIAGQETISLTLERMKEIVGRVAEPAQNDLPSSEQEDDQMTMSESNPIAEGGVLDNTPLEVNKPLKPPVPPGAVGN